VLLALAQTSTRLQARWGFRFLAVGTVLRAVSTYSRGGLLAFVTMCGVYWMRSTRKVVTLVAMVVLAFGVLSLMPSQYWDRMSTLKTTDQEQMDESAAGRVYFWGLAIDMAVANPLFGVGHNGYSRAFDRFDETGGKYGMSRAVHSTWFGVLADLGFPGLALFVAIFIASWFRCSSARKEALARGDTNLAAFAGALQTALTSFAIGGTFLSFQYVEMLWHFVALSIALRNIASQAAVTSTATEQAPAPFRAPAQAMG
jgi:probable O-glycosylation ligase (exosortase A-associated)